MNSDDYSKDLVCYQSTSDNSYVEEGTTIDIKLSLGAKAVTYSFSESITGPTNAEDPYYKPGIEVQVILTPDGGKELLNTKVTTFPMAEVNYKGITSSKGTITFIYTVSIEETVVEDDNGESVVIPARTEEHTIQRTVNFVQE